MDLLSCANSFQRPSNVERDDTRQRSLTLASESLVSMGRRSLLLIKVNIGTYVEGLSSTSGDFVVNYHFADNDNLWGYHVQYDVQA